MNNKRRKALINLRETISLARDELTLLLDEEEECRDNIPDNLLNSIKYEEQDAACYHLDEAAENLDAAIEEITEAIE